MELPVLISIIIDLFSFGIFAFCSIIASIQDIKTNSVSRYISATCLISVLLLHTLSLGIIYYDYSSTAFFLEKVTEPLRGAGIAFIIFELVRLMTNKQLGYADVLFAAIGGALIGAIWWLSGAFLSCIAGLVHFLRQKDEKPLPFIPFLCGGTTFMWILKITRIIVTHW